MKKIVLSSVVCFGLGVSLMANDVCDSAKIDKMFGLAKSQGANILKYEPSTDIQGFCEIYLEHNGRVDLVYANLSKNEFLSSAILVSYDEKLNSYAPKNLEKIQSINQTLEVEKYSSANKVLSDDKKLEEFFSYAFPETSKKDDKKFVNKQYEVLIFESLLCPYCKDLNSQFERAFSDKNIKLYKYYLPLDESDYNNLKNNYYKSEEKIKKALELKKELKIDGVPMVVVRDAKTKKFIELITAPTQPQNFEKIKSYIK